MSERQERTTAGSEGHRVYAAASLALTDPGPAAAGVYIVDAEGQIISHRSYYLGHARAEEAALRGAIAALRLVETLGLERPHFFVDERWLADLLRGAGDLPERLGAYRDDWQEALGGVGEIEVSMVSADANPARTVALAPLVKWLPERTRRAERLAVSPLGGGLYEVSSERQPGLVYRVSLPSTEAVAQGEHIGCECPDYQYRGIPCKHLLVVAQLAGERERLFYPDTGSGEDIPHGPAEATRSPEDARKERRKSA